MVRKLFIVALNIFILCAFSFVFTTNNEVYSVSRNEKTVCVDKLYEQALSYEVSLSSTDVKCEELNMEQIRRMLLSFDINDRGNCVSLNENFEVSFYDKEMKLKKQYKLYGLSESTNYIYWLDGTVLVFSFRQGLLIQMTEAGEVLHVFNIIDDYELRRAFFTYYDHQYPKLYGNSKYYLSVSKDNIKNKSFLGSFFGDAYPYILKQTKSGEIYVMYCAENKHTIRNILISMVFFGSFVFSGINLFYENKSVIMKYLKSNRYNMHF